MKIAGALALTFAYMLFVWVDLSALRRYKQERWCYMAIAALGWGLSVALLFVPELPSPTQAIDHLFKPLGRLLQPQE